MITQILDVHQLCCSDNSDPTLACVCTLTHHLTKTSGTFRFLIAHSITFLGTLSKAFSRLIKHIYSFLSLYLFLLQPPQNKYCIRCSLSIHETKLHLVHILNQQSPTCAAASLELYLHLPGIFCFPTSTKSISVSYPHELSVIFLSSVFLYHVFATC